MQKQGFISTKSAYNQIKLANKEHSWNKNGPPIQSQEIDPFQGSINAIMY